MKTALFVLLDQYADWEAAYLTSEINQRAGWEIKTASNLSQVQSIGGLRTTIDVNFADLAKAVDLLVLIGGNSWEIQSPELDAFIELHLTHQRPVAAICGAVDYLAKQGFLSSYRHTGNTQLLWQDFQNYQNPEDFIERQAVSDRNLVTANGTAALDFTEFTLQLIGDSLIEAKRTVDLYRLGYYDYIKKYGNPF